MAVVYQDQITVNTTSAESTTSWTPSAEIHGVIIGVFNGLSPQVCTGVTYAGEAATEIGQNDSVNTYGRVSLWFISGTFPASANNLVVSFAASVSHHAVAIGVTSTTGGIQVQDNEQSDGSGAFTSTLNLTSVDSYAVQVLETDAGSITNITPTTGWDDNVAFEHDHGTFGCFSMSDYNSQSTDITWGYDTLAGGRNAWAAAFSEAAPADSGAIRGPKMQYPLSTGSWLMGSGIQTT
jgi:hypothetical protein